MSEKCPKCGFEQTRNKPATECARCGVIFSKYNPANDKQTQTAPLTVKAKKKSVMIFLGLFCIFTVGIAGLIIFLPVKESFRGYNSDNQKKEQRRGLSLTNQYQYNSEKRIALIIGNGAYKSAPLKNPVNDAQLMKKTLSDIGFDVSYGENLSRNEMKKKISSFGRKLSTSGTGLFYYAGHGMQVKGRNFLLPVNENITNEEDVEYEGIDLSRVLGKMSNAGNRINIVILDACRNNPFSRNSRSGERGLAYVNAPAGTFIAYATGPGSVASDGRGINSVYTEQLAQFIQLPQLKIEDVFKQVRASVRKATRKRQTPWESTSLVGDFYFNTSGVDSQNIDSNDIELPQIYVEIPQKQRVPINKADNNIVDDDRAFALFQAAKSSKQKLDFDMAKEQLKQALTYISDDSSNYQDIADELYFHMPLHKAQWLLEKRENVELEKLLVTMKEYIEDHKKRFEYIQAIDRMETYLAMLDNQTCAEVAVQARNLLMEAQVYYAEMGKSPSRNELYRNNRGAAKYPVEVTTSPNDVITIRITDTSNRCRKGAVYVVSLPSLPSDGWQ